jgi:hypothetical protein
VIAEAEFQGPRRQPSEQRRALGVDPERAGQAGLELLAARGEQRVQSVDAGGRMSALTSISSFAPWALKE